MKNRCLLFKPATINSYQKTKIVRTITKKKDNTKHEYLKHVCLNFKKAPWSTNVTIVFETLAITNGHLGIIKPCFPSYSGFIWLVLYNVKCDFYSPISYFVAAILAVTRRFLTGFFLFELFTTRLRAWFV